MCISSVLINVCIGPSTIDDVSLSLSLSHATTQSTTEEDLGVQYIHLYRDPVLCSPSLSTETGVQTGAFVREQEANFLSVVTLGPEAGDRFLLLILYKSHVVITFIYLHPQLHWYREKVQGKSSITTKI